MKKLTHNRMALVHPADDHKCIVCGEPCQGDFCSEDCLAEYADDQQAAEDEAFKDYDIDWINTHWT